MDMEIKNTDIERFRLLSNNNDAIQTMKIFNECRIQNEK